MGGVAAHAKIIRLLLVFYILLPPLYIVRRFKVSKMFWIYYYVKFAAIHKIGAEDSIIPLREERKPEKIF